VRGLRRGSVCRCRDRTADGVLGRVGGEADELPGGFELLVLGAQALELQAEILGSRLDDPRGGGRSDAETRLGSQYTIDVVRALKARFPGVHFVWIMGADSLASFHRWRGWTEILREIPVAVVSRPWISLKSRFSPAARRFAGFRRPAVRAASLPGSTPPAWVFLTGPLNFQSSTMLRARQRGHLNHS